MHWRTPALPRRAETLEGNSFTNTESVYHLLSYSCRHHCFHFVIILDKGSVRYVLMETLFTFHMVFLEHIRVLCEASSLADLPILSFIDKCLGSLILLIKKKNHSCFKGLSRAEAPSLWGPHSALLLQLPECVCRWPRGRHTLVTVLKQHSQQNSERMDTPSASAAAGWPLAEGGAWVLVPQRVGVSRWSLHPN